MKRLLATTILFAFWAGAASGQMGAPARLYHIPSMPLKEALAELAQQAGLSISYSDIPLSETRSRYIYGKQTAREALAKLLAHSPYDFEFISEDTLRIIARETAALDQKASNAPQHAYVAPDAIVVTATKREAYAQHLPVSISAIDGDRLRELGVRDMNALAPKLAGVAVTNLGPSRNKVFLRGVSDGSFADRTQSTVGIYLDETPIIYNDTNPDLRLIDVDRIEIIRGPQGTLYGAGSVGGVYRMISNKPDAGEISGRLRVSASATENGGANGVFDGVVNLPVIPNRWAVRASGYVEKASGYIDDIGLGLEDVNSSTIYGGRVSSRWVMSDQWTFDIAANAQIVDLDDTQYIFSRLGGLRRNNARREPYRDDFKQLSATLNGQLRFGKLTSSSAFIRRDISSTFDATTALPDITGLSETEGIYVTENEIRTFSHELRLASESNGSLKWLIGGFYSQRSEDLYSRLTTENGDALSVPFLSVREDEVKEYAAFGELSYELIPDLILTSGLRWSRAATDVDVISDGSLNIAPEFLSDERTLSGINPKVALSYQYSDDLLIYIQIARGERVGGFNVTTPLAAIMLLDPDDDIARFEPDKLWNTELGVKSTWLDGDLIVNASAFYVRWSEIQTDQILPTGFSFIANAGKARNYGFEAEIAGRPLPNLEITGAFFWNSPELIEANPFLGASVGDALPNIAAVSASFAATYDFPLSRQWRGALSADYSYVGRSYLTFAEETAPSMGDYHVSNLRLTAQRDQLSVGVFADNLGNERGNTFAFGNPFSLSSESPATPLRPRTIGGFIEVAF